MDILGAKYQENLPNMSVTFSLRETNMKQGVSYYDTILDGWF